MKRAQSVAGMMGKANMDVVRFEDALTHKVLTATWHWLLVNSLNSTHTYLYPYKTKRTSATNDAQPCHATPR